MATLALALLAVAFAGCGYEADEHGHSHGPGATHGHSHGDDAQSFSGATHKEGEGITLLERTRKLLDVQVHEVEEGRVPQHVRFMVRVFTATSGKVQASGMLAVAEAQSLRTGQPVQLTLSSGQTITSAVSRVEIMPGSESEVILIFPTDAAETKFGDFLSASALIRCEDKTAVVPKEAVIQGAEGTFVYVVNGKAYLRTPVTTGHESDDRVEVREGLLPGDSVVSKGAMDLWLIELRAVKGGQGCCPAPPVKDKT